MPIVLKRIPGWHLEEKLNVVGCCVAIDILVTMPPSPEALVEMDVFCRTNVL